MGSEGSGSGGDGASEARGRLAWLRSPPPAAGVCTPALHSALCSSPAGEGLDPGGERRGCCGAVALAPSPPAPAGVLRSLPCWKVVHGVHGSAGGFPLSSPTPGLHSHLQCLAEPMSWLSWPTEAPVLGSCFPLEVSAHRFQVSFF